MASLVQDVCDLNHIYGEDFRYSLPRNILESYLDGKAFDHKESYSPEERNSLTRDINRLYVRILEQGPVREKIAVITAGAPGAGKTMLMRQDLEKQGGEIAYIDPDDVVLRTAMEETYQRELNDGLKDLSSEAEEYTLRVDLYNKWRPASNAAHHIILANLIHENYAFYFGTTSSSPATGFFFKFLKDRGYTIRLLHVTAPDEVRWRSIQERDKAFVQTTEEDTREKGNLVPQRIQDTYLKYADQIEFYYRDAADRDAVLAATWVRGKELAVHNQETYARIREIHNAVCHALGREDILWENIISSR